MQRRSDPGKISWLSQGITKVFPSGKAALQRTHAHDTKFLKLLCHTGTGGFIGSSTVENDLFVFWQLVRAVGDFGGKHAYSSGQGTFIGD